MLCRQCEQEKDKSYFNRDRTRTRGVRSICKDCRTFNAENARRIALENNSNRICFDCGVELSLDNFYKDNRRNDGFTIRCKKCSLEKNKKQYGKDRAKRLEYAKLYYDKRLKKDGENFREEIRTKWRINWSKLKREVMNAYGGYCKCCGENRIEFLTIEHSFNNGGEEKRKIGQPVVYRDLRKRGFPKDEGIEVLCMNCNMAKGHHNYCPHEKECLPLADKGYEILKLVLDKEYEMVF